MTTINTSEFLHIYNIKNLYKIAKQLCKVNINQIYGNRSDAVLWTLLKTENRAKHIVENT